MGMSFRLLRQWLSLGVCWAVLGLGITACAGHRQTPAPQMSSTLRFTPNTQDEFDLHRVRVAAFEDELLAQHFRIIARTNGTDAKGVTMKGSYDDLENVEIALSTATSFDRTKPCVIGTVRAFLPDDRAKQTFARLEGHVRMMVMGQDAILNAP